MFSIFPSTKYTDITLTAAFEWASRFIIAPYKCFIIIMMDGNYREVRYRVLKKNWGGGGATHILTVPIK